MPGMADTTTTFDFPMSRRDLGDWLAAKRVEGWAWDGESPEVVVIEDVTHLRYTFTRA